VNDSVGAALTQVLILFGAAVATGVARWLARRYPPPPGRRRRPPPPPDEADEDDA